MAVRGGERPRGGLEHRALLYGDIGSFLSALIPYVHDGLEADEPVSVVLSGEAMEAVRSEVAVEDGRVGWLDAREWNPHPAWRLRALHELVTDQLATGAPRLRLAGELPWPEGPTELVLEWERYESVLNEVLAPYPVSAMCTYDTRRLEPATVESARRTHPVIQNGGVAPSDAFLSPAELLRGRNAPVPRPPPGAAMLAVPHDLAEARQFIEREAMRVGMAMIPAMDLLIAVNEVLTNAITHAGGAVGMWVWVEEDTLVCLVEDRGPGIDDPLAGYRPPSELGSGGRGLWIARQLVDLLLIAPADPGTRVHLQARRA